MIKAIKGNILSVTEGTLVHGCNAQGIMGGGVALQIRNKWPDLFDRYVEWCSLGSANLGEVMYYHASDKLTIANAITQFDCVGGRRDVNYEAVALAFELINEDLRSGLIRGPVVFPMIGAGIGGGNWNIVASIIDNLVDDQFEKILYVYDPQG